jgi:hypothetical protein
MADDFDRIKSALADIARAVAALRTHPERDVTAHLNQIARAADAIKKHAGEAEQQRARAALQERRWKYAP